MLCVARDETVQDDRHIILFDGFIYGRSALVKLGPDGLYCGQAVVQDRRLTENWTEASPNLVIAELRRGG